MIEPTLASFRALFPEFASLPDATVQVWIDLAIEELNQSSWGQCYAQAVLYFAAHNLALSQQRGSQSNFDGTYVSISSASGSVSSTSADGLSVGYTSPNSTKSSDSNWFNRTEYGQSYLALAARCLSRARMSSC